MIDFNDIALFVQVVRSGSFSEAGRRLVMPPNTVSRRVQGLEDQLGARLMQRSTRKLTLTDAGQEFYRRCVAAIDDLQQASQDLTADSKIPSGVVRVAATVNFLDFYSPRLVASFLERYPQVRLEFLLDDAVVDLITDRIDVAFRGGSGDGPGYVAHRITVAPIGLYASPRYLEQRGSPRRLSELASHQCLTAPRQSGHTVWRLQGADRSEEHVEVTGSFAASTMGAIHAAALAGLGIGLLPGAIAAADVAAGRLAPVLPQYERGGQSMCVVYPSHRQVSPAVKAFVASVIKRFEDETVLPDG